MIPQPWELALLALAAFRVWKLLADDAIFDGPRSRILRGHPKIDDFVSCPWCYGAHIAVGWMVAWWLFPYQTLVVAVPFALSAAVGLIAAALSVATD